MPICNCASYIIMLLYTRPFNTQHMHVNWYTTYVTVPSKPPVGSVDSVTALCQ